MVGSRASLRSLSLASRSLAQGVWVAPPSPPLFVDAVRRRRAAAFRRGYADMPSQRSSDAHAQARRRNAASRYTDSSTIFALASGRGAAGIAVIRISGPATEDVYRRLCSPPNGCSLPLPASHKLALRNLYHPHSGELLDRAAVVFFEQGRSYTGEASLELHVHGGHATVRDVLDALSDLALTSPSAAPGPSPHGSSTTTGHLSVRPAEAGEFTRRAFLHGKLDLTSSEALHSLITSSTSAQRRVALQGAGGMQTRRYEAMRASLVEAMGMVEALIDFSDEEGVNPRAFSLATAAALQIQELIEQELGLDPSSALSSATGKRVRTAGGRHVGEILTSGVKLAIYGPPNAGKSSLLNALADREAAIVSDIPGTTRDVLQLDLDVGGYKVVVYDTAGIRSADEGQQGEQLDRVEQIGIERARAAVEQADMALLVYPLPDLIAQQQRHGSSHEAVTERPGVELPLLRPASYGEGDKDLVLFSKSDLVQSSSLPIPPSDRLTSYVGSTLTPSGLSALLDGLSALLNQRYGQHISPSSSAAPLLVTQTRHRHHLLECYDALLRFKALCSPADDDGARIGEEGTDLVLAAEELRLAARAIGKVTGLEVRPDEVLGEVFGRFCIGK